MDSRDEFRRIETPFGSIAARPDGKLVFIPRGQPVPFHYTFHPGTNSGFIDFHKKIEGKPVPTYETLFKVSHDEIAKELERIGRKLVPLFLGIVKPVTLAWLHHRGFAVSAGYYPSVNQLRRAGGGQGRRLKIDEGVMSKLIRAPEFFEDIFELEDRAFPIFKRRRSRPWRQVGTLFKGPVRPDNDPLLYWIKLRELGRVMTAVSSEMELLAQRYRA